MLQLLTSLCCCRSADGLSLIATSSDGYVTIFSFAEGDLGVPYDSQPLKGVPVGKDDTSSTAPKELSPIKPASSCTSTSVISTSLPPSSSHNGVELSRPSSDRSIKKEDSDIIILDGPPISASTTAPATSSVTEETSKKEKKRPMLTTVPFAGGN